MYLSERDAPAEEEEEKENFANQPSVSSHHTQKKENKIKKLIIEVFNL